MGAALQHGIRSGLLLPREYDTFIARLPAQQRADIAWAPTKMRNALRRLFAEPLTRDVVVECTVATLSAGLCAVRAVSELLEDPDFWRSEVLPLTGRHVERVRQYLPDRGAADAAEWALRALGATFEILAKAMDDPRAATVVPAAITALAGADDAQLEAMARHEELGALWRSEVMSLALLEGAEEGLDVARAEELADWAFIEADLWVRWLAGAGLVIDPFAGEAPADRVARQLRYSEDARRCLSADDHRALEAARLCQLR